MSNDIMRSALAYRVKCLANADKPIPFDLFAACHLAGLDPERIYEDECSDIEDDEEWGGDIILDDPADYPDDVMDLVCKLNQPGPCRTYDEEE